MSDKSQYMKQNPKGLEFPEDTPSYNDAFDALEADLKSLGIDDQDVFISPLEGLQGGKE